MGFSLGGSTALEVAWNNLNIKYCVALDPYMLVYPELLQKDQYAITKIPLLMVIAKNTLGMPIYKDFKETYGAFEKCLT